MRDELGDRMKSQYEDRTRIMLPRRTYTIIRVDGKAFHTFTKGFDRPFDQELIDMMDSTAKALCEGIQGAKLAYVQSDEISILVTDFEQLNTCAWFDGNLQKMVSVSASIATQAFNNSFLKSCFRGTDEENKTEIYAILADCLKQAHFDSRVFTISDPVEVENYFIWRQQDASRNSVQMVARSLYSHKECENKNNPELQDMIYAKGQNWNDFPAGQKRGRCIVKSTASKEVTYNGETKTVERSVWVVAEPPIFTQERNWLRGWIPRIGE